MAQKYIWTLIKSFIIFPAVFLVSSLSQTAPDLHPAKVHGSNFQSSAGILHSENKNPADSTGRVIVSPVGEQIVIDLRKYGPVPISNQENAFGEDYPVNDGNIHSRDHITGARYPGIINFAKATDKDGIPGKNKATANSLFIFLTALAIILFITPLILPAAKRFIFAESDRNLNEADNIRKDEVPEHSYSVVTEEIFQQATGTSDSPGSINGICDKVPDSRKTTEKNGRIVEINTKRTGNRKIITALRYSTSNNSGIPDSRIVEKFNHQNSNTANTLQKLAAVHKIALATSSDMELDEVFHDLLEITINTLGSEIGYILQYDQKREVFLVRSFISSYGMSPKLGEIPLAQQNVSTLVYQSRKPLLIRDINETPQFSSLSVFGYERRSLICVPLIVQNETIGTMVVVNKINDSLYNSEDMKFLSTIASQAGLAIKNAKLHEEQKKAYMNIVHALVSIIEASDSYTKGHSDRVSFYCGELARKINLPRNRIDIVERAAILHDIGKIGINVYLLNKEIQLSPEEIDKLRQHPLIGMKILEPLEFLKDVSTCIGQHHERVDGTGYPYGIPGDKLLLESQILAIGDAYDAMTSDRPYRLALSRAEAIKELKENAGKQHNHDLVRHFVEMLENGRLDILNRKPGIIPSFFMDFDPASEFFTDFSYRPLMSGMVESR